ncbi:MAG: amidohydrolase family protein, partial [Candidatus Acidiferrales bacterium]
HYRALALSTPAAFIVENAPVIALTHARVIDGTGTPPLNDQTLILQSGLIAAYGAADALAVPAGARVLDLSGKTVMPGLVMMHEHLFTIAPNFSKTPLAVEQDVPFPLMYLGAGVTTMRTAGSINGEADLALKHAIDSGARPGPDIFLTAPYLEGKPELFPQMGELAGPDDARQRVDKWAAAGMSSFKAYMHISPEELKAAIDEAHAKGLKITGHLCSVGFTEAADMGIDNLEHGIVVDEEFFPVKQEGVCPDQFAAFRDFEQRVDIRSAEVQAMTRHLVDHHVAMTSTLAVFADFSMAGETLAAMKEREQRALSWQSWLKFRLIRGFVSKHPFANSLSKEMQFERDFAAAGGLLMAGSDPTGDGGTLAGYADQEEIELLVRAGFSPVEAIHIATANGAEFLGQSARIGTIAQGKQADLVVVDGDPSRRIADIRNVEIVFRKGVGYSAEKLFGSVRGLVGVP